MFSLYLYSHKCSGLSLILFTDWFGSPEQHRPPYQWHTLALEHIHASIFIIIRVSTEYIQKYLFVTWVLSGMEYLLIVQTTVLKYISWVFAPTLHTTLQNTFYHTTIDSTNTTTTHQTQIHPKAKYWQVNPTAISSTKILAGLNAIFSQVLPYLPSLMHYSNSESTLVRP